MIALSVNLNKIALIRNSRDTTNPDIPQHAQLCIDAGADGITVHPRPDQRHIRASDCFDLAGMLKVEFNIEGNPFSGPRTSSREGVDDYPGFMELVKEIRPSQCTLVPDGDGQLTSDHGFDLQRDGDRVAPIIEELRSLGIRTSLFMDPDPDQIRLAAQTGSDRIELYTESYARAHRENADVDAVFAQFVRAAEIAREENLGVNAGHDLDLHNLPRFATLPGLLEVSIGHALTVDALRMGLAPTVAAYQKALGERLMDARLEALLDKQAITELIHTYCNAADRHDYDLMRSLYHEDATDNHGAFFKGLAMDFIDRLPEIQAPMNILHHNITTLNIALEGDYGEGEVYVLAFHQVATEEKPVDLLIGGRYFDRYEKRAGIWKFSERAVVADWATFTDPSAVSLDHPMVEGSHIGSPGPKDPSYRFFRLLKRGRSQR